MAWRSVRDRFRSAGLATPELDARRLSEASFGLEGASLTLREAETANPAAMRMLEDFAQRRLRGEPVARILGEQEFYGLPFRLNHATLVPRPETELLVDLAVARLSGIPEARLLDLGTGTGAIAVAILHQIPNARAVAIDLSAEAVLAARENATRSGVAERIAVRTGSWFEPLRKGEMFDLIISNPPYIESAVIDGLQPEVRDFDPRLALDGGPDGLAPFRVIAAGARERLSPGGTVMTEIGSTQARAVQEIFGRAAFGQVRTEKDLAGLDRVIIAHHFNP